MVVVSLHPAHSQHPRSQFPDTETSSTMGGANLVVISSTEQWKEALAAAGSKAVLVDFYADWCGPCKVIAPKFAEIADQNADTLVCLKVNVDENEEIAKICNISAMPTFQVYKDGALADTLVGANLEKLNALVAKYK